MVTSVSLSPPRLLHAANVDMACHTCVSQKVKTYRARHEYVVYLYIVTYGNVRSRLITGLVSSSMWLITGKKGDVIWRHVLIKTIL